MATVKLCYFDFGLFAIIIGNLTTNVVQLIASSSQDWPKVIKYTCLVCALIDKQKLIQDLYKTWHDPIHGTLSSGMIH